VLTISQKFELLKKLLGPGDIDRRGVNAQFWCPFCKHVDSKKRKLAVRLEDGVTHCWVCNKSARTPAKFVPLYNAYDLLPELEKAFGAGGELFKEAEEVPDEMIAEVPSDFALVCDEIDRGVIHPDKIAAIRYLEMRGVTYNTAKYFRLGLSNQEIFRRRIVFPSFDDKGTLNYVTARAVDSQTTFKYFNTQRQRSTLVFNEVDVDWSRELVLVEGPFDLLACIGMNAVPMLGSWLDENYVLFNRIVSNRTPIVLALDPDAFKKQELIARKLLQYEVPVRAVDWSGCADDDDPSKVGSKRFKQMVVEAPVYNKESVFKSKLNRVLCSTRLRT
jgi:DNA primase